MVGLVIWVAGSTATAAAQPPVARNKPALTSDFVPLSSVLKAAQVPTPDDELARHLTTIRSQLENLTIDIARREELALEMAATLDRAAQTSPDSNVRRRRWSEAIDLLDWFLKENTDPPRERQLRFQAAVLRWAQARSWVETGLRARSTDHEARREARALDNAIERFRAVTGEGNNPTLTDNLRFRLAEALADRADLEPAAGPPLVPARARPWTCWTNSPSRDGLAGYWHLLKADLFRRLGKAPRPRRNRRRRQVDARSAAGEVVEVNIPLLIDRKRYDDAIKSLGLALDKPVKALWMVRIRLAQLPSLPPGTSGSRSSPTCSRGSRSCEHRPRRTAASTLELARTAVEPDANQPPEVWESLADAYGFAAEPARAGAAMMRAAAFVRLRRETRHGGRGSVARRRVFVSGRRLRCRRQSFVASRRRPGRRLRAKAGMLRCLARGRALAAGLRRLLDGSLHDGPRRAASRFSRRPLNQRSSLAARRAGRRRRRAPAGRNALVGDRPIITALARLATGHRGPRSRRTRPPANQSRSPQVARAIRAG